MPSAAQRRAGSTGTPWCSSAGHGVLRRSAAIGVSSAMVVLVLAGCGGAGELSAAAQRGRKVAEDRGCTACHSVDGSESIGPTWQGLYGSTVELQGGAQAVADEEHLTRAIQEPAAHVRAGFRPIMPERPLEPAELGSVLAYLQEIGGAS